jgi:hypothetical protein
MGDFESMRVVGVEIETERGDDRYGLAYDLPDYIGVETDGSLDDTGIEIITPRASGDELGRILQSTCKTIANHNFMATKSCGLHIHLDGRHDFIEEREIKGAKVSRLLRAYYAIEPMLYAMLPASRFDNHYCLSIRGLYDYSKLKTCNPEKLEVIWYKEMDKDSRNQRKNNKYDNTRYCGINLHSLFYRGSIEIRYHSGSIDYQKIKNWIRLNQAIIDYVVKRYRESEIIGLIKRPERYNVAEIAKVLRLPPDLVEYINERILNFKGDK